MDIGSVIGGGFRLIREKPVAVAAWAFLYLLAFVAMSYAMRPWMQAQVQAAGDPQVQLANMGAMIGRILLIGFLFLLFYTILFAASQRAVLQPERSGFFYLRLGMDELRLFVLTIIFTIGFYIAMVVVVLVLALLIGLFAATAGQSFATTMGVMVVVYVLMLLAGIWFATRFALAYPLTVMRGKLVIGESWRITRGRFWPLFAAFLIVLLLVLALWIVGSLVTSGGYFAELARNGGDRTALEHASQQQMARQLGGVTGTMVAGWVIGAIAGALGVALWGGTVATAARELTFDRDRIADTFA